MNETRLKNDGFSLFCTTEGIGSDISQCSVGKFTCAFNDPIVLPVTRQYSACLRHMNLLGSIENIDKSVVLIDIAKAPKYEFVTIGFQSDFACSNIAKFIDYFHGMLSPHYKGAVELKTANDLRYVIMTVAKDFKVRLRFGMSRLLGFGDLNFEASAGLYRAPFTYDLYTDFHTLFLLAPGLVSPSQAGQSNLCVLRCFDADIAKTQTFRNALVYDFDDSVWAPAYANSFHNLSFVLLRADLSPVSFSKTAAFRVVLQIDVKPRLFSGY